MKAIISDTTAIIALLKIDSIFIISNLYQKVYIPNAVKEEILKKDDEVKKRFKKLDFIEKKDISDINLFNKLKLCNIDRGEIEAITLASEFNLRLIIDEAKGRKKAVELNLKIVGVLGLIILNFQNNFITKDESLKIFNDLIKNQFRVSEKITNWFLSKFKD